MKIYRIFVLAIIINSVWGISYDLLGKSNNNSNNRELGFHTIIGVMVDFPYEDTNDPNSTGRGHFLSEIDADLISSRCDGFLVDPPPHNADYFRDQIQAVKNYFSFNINSSNEDVFDFHVLEQSFRLSKTMRDYSVSDSTIGELFSEAVDLAFSEGDLLNQDWYEEDEASNYLFVIFHAGVGQDISFPYLDPANYDIPSAYIDSQMLNESWEYYDNIEGKLHADIPEIRFLGNYLSLLGTDKYSVGELKEAFHQLGSTYYFNATENNVSLIVSGIESNLEKILVLTEELINNLVFDEVKVSQAVEEFKTQRKLNLEQPMFLAQTLNEYALLGNKAPRLRELTKKEIKKLTKDEILKSLEKKVNSSLTTNIISSEINFS